MSRKFLAAKEEIVRELCSIAEKKKTTLYGLTNDILEQAIKALETGEELSEIIREYSIIKMAKQNRCVLIPERIWYTVLDSAFRTDKASIKETSHESGLWYGKYFSAIMNAPLSNEMIQSAFQTIFWNASSFDVSQAGDKIKLRCIEPNFTDSHTEFVAIMLEGIMNSLGYLVNEREVARGLITFTLTEKSAGEKNSIFKEG
jgi:hypothetical protein